MFSRIIRCLLICGCLLVAGLAVAQGGFVLVSSTPVAGATGVSASTTVQLRFSAAVQSPLMAPIWVRALETAMPPIYGTAVVGGAGNTQITFTPDQALPFGLVEVDFSGVLSATGQNIQSVTTTLRFTVGGPADTLRPTLVSSNPAGGATNIATGATALSLTFSEAMNQSGNPITLSGPAGDVPLTLLSSSGAVMNLRIDAALQPGATYTVNYGNAADLAGNPVTGAGSYTFTTASAMLYGTVTPASLRLEANTPAGVTYLLQNRSSGSVTLRSPQAEYLVNNVVVATLAAPLSVPVPAVGTGQVTDTVRISEAIRAAALAANTDQITVRRAFSDGARAVTVLLRVQVGSSQAAAAAITSAVVDYPRLRTAVTQHDELRPHAIIRGTGNGTVVGVWQVDGAPLETFQLTIIAGQSLEVQPRRSVPTYALGEHAITLRLIQPSALTTQAATYVVLPRQVTPRRVMLLGPAPDAALAPDAVRVSYRWLPTPDAVGYELAFAADPAALGFTPAGTPLAGARDWDGANRQLRLLVRVPALPAIWTPTMADYARLCAGSPRTLFWAVRAIYTTRQHGDPATTSPLYRLRVLPMPAPLRLLIPGDNVTLDARDPLFTWEAVPDANLYQFTLSRNGETIFTAQTDTPRFAFQDDLSVTLAPGRYAWQVIALKSGVDLVAASGSHAFTVTRAAARAPRALLPAPLLWLAANDFASPGTGGGLAFSPADGAAVEDAQPLINIILPAATERRVQVLLDDVDVTNLASIAATTISLTPPQPLAEGAHTVTVLLAGEGDTLTRAAATFHVAGRSGDGAASALAPGTPATNARLQLPVRFQLNSNWSGGNQQASHTAVNMDTLLQGEPRLELAPGAYSTMNFHISRPDEGDIEMSSLLVEAGAQNGRHTAQLGDVGASAGAFAISGLSSRGLSLATNLGPVKMTAIRSIHDDLGRKSYGPVPEVLVFTAEPVSLAGGRTLKLVYVDNVQPDPSGQTGDSTSKVYSLIGETPLGLMGMNLRGEMARSAGTQQTGLGAFRTDGLAMALGVTGQVGATSVSLSHRRVDADFASPANPMLSADLQGWDINLSRPLGPFLSASVNGSLLANTGSSSAPDARNTSLGATLSLGLPRLPALTLGYTRTGATADPAFAGGQPMSTVNTAWNAGASHQLGPVNLNVNYAKSIFTDRYDIADAVVDTPRDRDDASWSFGLSSQPLPTLSLSADWGRNLSGYAFRDWETNALYSGEDRNANMRACAQWTPLAPVSLSLAWSRSDAASAMNPGATGRRDLDARLNVNLARNVLGQHQFTLSTGWHKSSLSGPEAGHLPGEFTIQLGDTLSFDL